jgi:4-nitrophenyl phosphatase
VRLVEVCDEPGHLIRRAQQIAGTPVLSDRSLTGYQVLSGAIELLSELKKCDIPFVVITNGRNYPPSEQASRLRALGLPISDGAFLTPSSAAADLMPRRGVKRALVLGTPGVGHALLEAGIRTVFTDDEGTDRVDAVYIGWQPDCRMKDIERAAKAIWNRAELYVASDVPFFATAGGKTMGYSYYLGSPTQDHTRAYDSHRQTLAPRAEVSGEETSNPHEPGRGCRR